MAHVQARGAEVSSLSFPQTSAQVAQKSPRLRKIIRGYWLYALAVPILLVMALPYIYLILQSLAAWNQVNRLFIPTSYTFRSYEWLFSGGGYLAQPWLQALLNSLFITLVDGVAMVALGAIIGYALSVMDFRGKRFINSFILFQMFYPGIILLVPTFLIIRYAGLFDTYWAMIIPKLLSLWAVFLYTGFFRSVPTELIEAARIDGASELRIIFNIMMPMARSITTIIFLFVCMERWTELMWDLIVVKDPNKQTLNVLLSTMFGPYGTYPGPLYAAGVLLTLPILILFMFFSRNFVRGVQLVLR